MSIQAVAWAWEQAVPGNAKLVLLALANHADHVSGRCRFEPEAVALQASIKPTSLWRYLGALERNGFLVRETAKGRDGEERDFWLKFDRATAAWDWGRAREDDDEPERSDAAEAGAAFSAAPPPPAFRAARQAGEREKVRAAAPTPPAFYFVREGTRAWAAWQAHYREQGRVMKTPMWGTTADGSRALGHYFPTLFPPGSALLGGPEAAEAAEAVE